MKNYWAQFMENKEASCYTSRLFSNAFVVVIPGLTYIGVGIMGVAFANAYSSAIPFFNLPGTCALGAVFAAACISASFLASRCSKKNECTDIKKSNAVDVVGALFAAASTVACIHLLSQPGMMGDALTCCGLAISGVAMIAQSMLLIMNFSRDSEVTASRADPNLAK